MRERAMMPPAAAGTAGLPKILRLSLARGLRTNQWQAQRQPLRDPR